MCKIGEDDSKTCNINNTLNIRKSTINSEKQEDKQENVTTVNEKWLKYTGNHAVVLLELPNENVKLIIDPTNPSIGIFQNGKITIFNEKYNKNSMLYIPLGSVIHKGVEGLIDVSSNYFTSWGFENYDELNKNYGVKAQNEALEEVRALNKNDWYSQIRVDVSKTKKSDKSKKMEVIKNKDEYIR